MVFQKRIEENKDGATNLSIHTEETVNDKSLCADSAGKEDTCTLESPREDTHRSWHAGRPQGNLKTED